MIRFTVAIFISVLSSSNASAGEYSPVQSMTMCNEEWPSDYQMAKYCMDKDVTGWNSYRSLRTSAPGFIPAFNFCEKKWHTDWKMVDYCAKKQIKGVDGFTSAIAGLPKPIADQILNTCLTKWPDQYDMVAYCGNKQATAWRAVNQ